MGALEKLVRRCNEMDFTEQDQWLGDVFMPAQARQELERLQAIEAAARALVDMWGSEMDGYPTFTQLEKALERQP